MTERSIVDELVQAALDSAGPRHEGRTVLPSRASVLAFMDGIRQVFFPGYFGDGDVLEKNLHREVSATLERVLKELEEQVVRAVAFANGHAYTTCAHCREQAVRAVRHVESQLPRVRRMLASDVQAAFDGDPALKTREEAIFSYPGIYAITEQRVAHQLHKLEVPLIPRMITEHAHSVTGIDIHPGAHIGERFFVDHGTGVVVGETCRIGRNVRLYQGVTLGAKSFPLDGQGRPIKGVDRHPVVEDDVVIYAGATLLGRITIGRGSSIGGNVWLTHSVPPGSRITQDEGRDTAFEYGGGI